MEVPTSPEVYWVLTTEYAWWPAIVGMERDDEREILPNQADELEPEKTAYDPTDKRVLVQLLDLNIK